MLRIWLKTLFNKSYSPILGILFLIFFLPALSQAKPSYWVYAYIDSNTDVDGNTITFGSDIPWNDITHLVDTFAVPGANGALTNEDFGAPLVTGAHANATRACLSIGGADGAADFSEDVGTYRTTFIANIMKAVTVTGYDGIDIDWEFPASSDEANLNAFMSTLYADLKALPNCAIDGQPHSLTIYIGCGDEICVSSWAMVASNCDEIILSGYDFGYDVYNGPIVDTSQTMSNSCDGLTGGYADVTTLFTLLTSNGVAPAKCVLGSPLYGNYPAGGYNEVPIITLLTSGTAGAFNAPAMEQLYTYQGNATTANTETSFCDKINWALGQGMKGIGLWDTAQACPITNTYAAPIWNTIGGNNACVTVGAATPTSTVSSTATKTFTATVTKTPTATFTNTAQSTATFTNTLTKTVTATATLTFTSTVTNTFTSTIADSSTPTNTPTKTYSQTATNTRTSTITNTPTLTPTATMTDTGTLGPTNTFTLTPTYSSTGTFTATPSLTTTNTMTYTVTNTPTHTNTVVNTPTSTGTSTFTLTATNTPNGSTSTATYTATASHTNTFTNTATLTDTATRTSTPTSSSTVTNSFTATNTSTFTSTPSYTDTATMTNTPTVTFTLTSTFSSTDTATPTNSPTKVDTATVTSTQTLTWTPTRTATATPTAIHSVIYTAPYPNPVSTGPVEIDVTTPGAATIEMEVFTTSFRKIVERDFTAGGGNGPLGTVTAVQWNLLDKMGTRVANGVYYIRLQIVGQPDTVKIFKVLVLR